MPLGWCLVLVVPLSFLLSVSTNPRSPPSTPSTIEAAAAMANAFDPPAPLSPPTQMVYAPSSSTPATSSFPLPCLLLHFPLHRHYDRCLNEHASSSLHFSTFSSYYPIFGHAFFLFTSKHLIGLGISFSRGKFIKEYRL